MTGQTDHEKAIEAVAAKLRSPSTFPGETATAVARELIDAYLKARNAEPVAWTMKDSYGCDYITMSKHQAALWPKKTPLYAAQTAPADHVVGDDGREIIARFIAEGWARSPMSGDLTADDYMGFGGAHKQADELIKRLDRAATPGGGE